MAVLFFSAKTWSQQWTIASAYGGTVAAFIDQARAVCTDAAGNVYITGSFNESINFGNGTATLTAVATSTHTDGFVAKFNSSGLCQWSIRFGGSGTDLGGFGIVSDGTSVFVTGQSLFPSTISSTALTTVGGSGDGVVFSLNAGTGAVNWAKAFGGNSATDIGQAACLDGSGNLYISGIFSTRTDPSPGDKAYFGASLAFPRIVQGSMTQATSDLFVAQLNASTGAFNWVSTGGSTSSAAPLTIANDNLTGSGIAFVPSLNEVVVSGSFSNANAQYFSNGSASPAVSLTNAGGADICVLELDLSGNFLSGVAAGGTTNDEGLGIAYDASTSATYITGYFNSASVAGGFSLTNSASGFDEIFYARYNPSTNTFPWVKSASGSAGGADGGFSIASNGNAGIFISGRLQGTTSFPTATTPLVSISSGADDIFLVKVNAANGNAITIADADGASGTDNGLGVATAPGGNVWVTGVFADNTVTFVPSSPTLTITAALDQEIFLAKYNDPTPVIGSQPAASTTCVGLASSFTVGSVTGGSGFTYQWQEDDNAGFASPTALTNTGIYSTVTTATLNISDNSTVNGNYYRVIVTNSAGNSATSNGAQLTATTPTLPTGNLMVVQTVNTSNNLYYGSSCRIVGKVVPSGGTPISGNVTVETWREASVLTHGGRPYVQRHYQVTPTAGSTGTITLYFSQADFDNFNAAPGSTLDLPTGPADAAGKANMRFSKFNGSSNNGTGLPSSYTSTGSIIDPVDANIVWNATFSRWEVTLVVSGFSGFFMQTFVFVLPVNLESFSAQRSNNDIRLKWQTASENDNDYFELQRSPDGKNFTPVTQVPGMNGTGTKNYEWNDAAAALLNSSRIFYRLKIVSLSGNAEYSNIVVVYLNKGNALITGVNPNPFANKIDIGLNMPNTGQLMIKLTDISGAVVRKEYAQAPKGFSTYTITAMDKIAKGVYILSIEHDGEIETYKLVK
jgi:hypothetical protein